MSIILTYQSMLTSSQMSLSLLKKKVFESQCYHCMFEGPTPNMFVSYILPLMTTNQWQSSKKWQFLKY